MAKKQQLKKRFYVSLAASLLLAAALCAYLTSPRWTAYAYVLSSKNKEVLMIGDSGTKNGCHRLAHKKLEAGVPMTRYENANAYMCGKYCFEMPALNLKLSHITCMMREENHL